MSRKASRKRKHARKVQAQPKAKQGKRGIKTAPRSAGAPALMRLWFALAVLLCAPVLRLGVLVQQGAAPILADALGIISDLLVGAAVLVGLWWALRIPGKAGKILAGALVVIYLTINIALAKYALYFEAANALHRAHFMLDPTFLGGSALTPPTLALFFALCAIILFPLWRARRNAAFPNTRALVICSGGTFAALVIAVLLPVSFDYANWRQRNLILANAESGLQLVGAAPAALQGEADAQIAALFRPDLSGESLLTETVADAADETAPPNVLLIMLEGVAGGFLPSVAAAHGLQLQAQMPQLDAFAAGGMSWHTMWLQQRQTNRGMYAVLCGDYPKLDYSEAKLNEYVFFDRKRRCLPHILADAGYQTAYLQAAPLRFMQKDAFLPRAGFAEVLGAAAFEGAPAHSRDSSWGVDDRTLLQRAHAEIRRLEEQDAPWFLTVLTVGTHHPYSNVPQYYEAPGGVQGFARALHWTDLALAELFDGLREEGILENTLVVVTADESNGVQSGDNNVRLLSRNWGPLVVVAPGVPAMRPEAPALHSDIGLSVLDYLRLSDAGRHFVGRSLLRRYDAPRALHFSNIGTGYANRINADGEWTACDIVKLSECVAWRPADVRTVFGGYERVQPNAREVRRIQQAAALAGAGAEDDARESWSFKLIPDEEIALTAERVQQHDGNLSSVPYMTIPAQHRAKVELEYDLVGDNVDGEIVMRHRFFSAPDPGVAKPIFTDITDAPLKVGQRQRLEYWVDAGRELVDCNFPVEIQRVNSEGLHLRFHQTQVTVVPSGESITEEAVARIMVNEVTAAPAPRS